MSGISNEIFRQIETVENEHDAATAAALQAVERRGEMVVRILEPRSLTRSAAEASRRFLALQVISLRVLWLKYTKKQNKLSGYSQNIRHSMKQTGFYIRCESSLPLKISLTIQIIFPFSSFISTSLIFFVTFSLTITHLLCHTYGHITQ